MGERDSPLDSRRALDHDAPAWATAAVLRELVDQRAREPGALLRIVDGMDTQIRHVTGPNLARAVVYLLAGEHVSYIGSSGQYHRRPGVDHLGAPDIRWGRHVPGILRGDARAGLHKVASFQGGDADGLCRHAGRVADHARRRFPVHPRAPPARDLSGHDFLCIKRYWKLPVMRSLAAHW